MEGEQGALSGIVKGIYNDINDSFIVSSSRLKERHVLLSADGPHRNVLKFKSPLVFSVEDAMELVSKLDAIMDEMEQVEVCRSISTIVIIIFMPRS